MHADSCLVETNDWASWVDHSSDGTRDHIAADLIPLIFFSDAWDGILAGGAVVSRLSHLATHDYPWTPLGVAGPFVPDRLAFDAVIMSNED